LFLAITIVFLSFFAAVLTNLVFVLQIEQLKIQSLGGGHEGFAADVHMLLAGLHEYHASTTTHPNHAGKKPQM
jgi:hypothetical protein